MQINTEDNKKEKRRGHNEGTARYNEDRKRWEARFSYTDPATGEVKRKMFTADSRPEAMKRGKEFLKNLEDGLLPDADKLALWDWLDRWLTDYIKPKVRVKSYEKYETSLRCYIKPTIGHITINKLKSPDIQRVFNDMQITGGREGKGVSTSTVRVTRRYLSMALAKAIEVGIILKNPCKATEQPRLVKEEINPLTQVQADLLLKTAKEGEYYYFGVKQRRKPTPASDYHKAMAYTAVMLALNTGMRLGEVFGLKWSDIDLDKGVIFVQRSLVSSNVGMIFEEPKTKGSKRRIPVTADTIQSLKQFKAQQTLYSNIMGDLFDNDEGIVFASLNGKASDTHNFTSRYFKKMLAQAGLDCKFKFHDLRHTHATLLLGQQVNIKVISERLGHSNITMTLDTYSHLMPDMQETAVKALEALSLQGL